MARRRFILALLLFGILLLTVALTANLTGLDPEGNWGPARRQVLVAGLVLLGATAATWLWPAITQASGRVAALTHRVSQSRWGATVIQVHGRVAGRVRTTVAGSAIGRWMAARPERPARIAAGLIFCLAVPVAVWFVSVGFWSHWPATGHYYDDLAQAFRSGQLHLLETPDPALLALPDPYEFEQRRHIPAPWDVVLYNGRFYLYWGPVPALLLAAWKAFSSAIVGDNALVFAFVLGTALFTLLTLAEIWNARYRGLGAAALVPALLVAAFAHPLYWLLNRPAVYEASIAAGQCFLMAGVFFASRGLLRGRIRGWRLALAGACWACAIGSRTTLAPAAAFWACLTVVASSRRGHGAVRHSAPLVVLPVLIGLLAIGWYNAERFGSPFELGHRYQLTGMNLHENYGQVFSPSNLLINASNYLFRPLRTLSVFPYLKPDWGITAVPLLTWLGRHFPAAAILNPPLYYAEQVTGLVYTLPFAGFAIVGLMFALRRADHVEGEPSPGIEGDDRARRPARTLILALVLGSALAFTPSLLFVVATTRYLADVVPTLVLPASVGSWEWITLRRGRGESIGWVLALVWLAALASVAVSLLLAVTGYDMRFERLNPELFDRIVRFLAP